jgi:hypothetical protein
VAVPRQPNTGPLCPTVTYCDPRKIERYRAQICGRSQIVFTLLTLSLKPRVWCRRHHGYFDESAKLPRFTLLTSGNVTSASEIIRTP